GAADGYASAPYPGDFGGHGPGTAASVGGLPPPPPYPLIAASSHPVAPSGKVEQPGYRLGAESSATGSRAAGEAGFAADALAIGRASAVADVAAAADRLVASSEARQSAIVIGDVLRIGSITATAAVMQPVGAALERRSALAVEGVTVGGTPVELGDHALVLDGEGLTVE